MPSYTQRSQRKPIKTVLRDANAGDILSSEPDPSVFMDISRDLVANCHTFHGRGATLRFHGGGPHFGLTIWSGTKCIGYLDAADLNEVLRKALSRGMFLNVSNHFHLYAENAQMRLDNGTGGWKLNDSKASPDRAAEPETQGARDCRTQLFVVTGGREKKRQCSEQT